jgi:molybdate transport system regulatory protein
LVPGIGATGRIWLAYLLIRFTSAKLGEVVAIQERDVDLVRGTLRLGAGKDGRAGREVQLPRDVVQALRAYLEDPDTGRTAGEVFRLDQGFVRRKFYQRADACSIPRDLASPRVLRASRALELLRGGVPLPVVQRILGQKSANLTAGYVDYEPADVSHVFEAYLLNELRTRTSARNLFAGRIARIKRGQILSEVELKTAAGHRIVSVITNTSLDNLGLKRGSPATGLIKAPSVTIVRSAETPATSARNVLRGRVKAVRSDGVLAEIVAMLSGGVEVCALITAHSAERLGLVEADEVWVVFDTSAVILSIAWHG